MRIRILICSLLVTVLMTTGLYYVPRDTRHVFVEATPAFSVKADCNMGRCISGCRSRICTAKDQTSIIYGPCGHGGPCMDSGHPLIPADPQGADAYWHERHHRPYEPYMHDDCPAEDWKLSNPLNLRCFGDGWGHECHDAKERGELKEWAREKFSPKGTWYGS